MIPKANITLEDIRQARRKRIVLKMIVCADDSSDKKRERIFAIAGIMGTQEEWDTIEIKWKKRTGGKIFHATDCEAGYKEYKNIPKTARLEEYKDLTIILAQSTLIGYGVAMDIGAYKALRSNSFRDAPYFFCFVRVINHFAKIVCTHYPKERVKYVFDIDHNIKYNAAYLYNNFLIDCKDWVHSFVLEDEIAFSTRRAVGIQVADLFAKETMKLYDNQFGPTRRPIRKSAHGLLKTNRFFCEYYHKEYFEWFANNVDAFQKYYGMEQDKYEKWLIDHKCQDTGENRVKFLIDLDSKNNSHS